MPCKRCVRKAFYIFESSVFELWILLKKSQSESSLNGFLSASAQKKDPSVLT